MTHPIALLSSAAATLALLAAGIRWLAPLGWMDHPDPRKHHGRPTPRVGGIVLLGALALGHAFGAITLSLTPLQWSAVYGMGLLGALDDRFNLSPRLKSVVALLWAVPLGAEMAWSLLHDGAGILIFGLSFPEIGPLVMSLLVFWFAAIPHAFNLIDGINGLSIGLASLLLLFTGHGPGSAPVIWGALGVLFLANYPRARHFMGDAGALSLGLLVAILAMKASLPYHAGRPLFLLAYPIVDVSAVVLIRALTRQRLTAPDRNHLHHWMTDHLPGRAWLATPILLLLAALPMTRNLSASWADDLSRAGYVALAGFALINLCQKVAAHRARLAVTITVRRPIPEVAPAPVREGTGAQSLT